MDDVKLNRIRTRDVYLSALAAFVGLVGFEGVRMATGHDPALAAKAAVATPAPDRSHPYPSDPRTRRLRRRRAAARERPAAPEPPVVNLPDTDPLHQLTWLAARSSGLVAWALAALATILGLAMAARRIQSGPDARRLHQHLTLAGLIALAIHGATIALDPWLKGGVVGVLVPFTIGYRPLAVAVGILAGWLMIAFAASWYLRRRIGARTWRYAHRFTPVVFVAATVHALTAGSDAGTWWMTLVAFALCGTAAGLLAARWLVVGSRSPRTVRPARAPAVSRAGTAPAAPAGAPASAPSRRRSGRAARLRARHFRCGRPRRPRSRARAGRRRREHARAPPAAR